MTTDERLERHPLSQAVRAAAPGVPTHVVGGAIRDSMLSLPPADLDVVLAHGAAAAAQRLAASLPARLVPLGQERHATSYRLVTDGAVLDLSDRSRGTLRDELIRRDFTINSMALDLGSGSIVDPLGGRLDLCRRLLRANRPGTFVRDPLRVLRLARHVAQLPGFAAEAATLQWARSAAPLVETVAPERIRAELSWLLEAPRAAPAVVTMVHTGLFPRLWLDGSAPPPDRGLERSLEALRRLTRWPDSPLYSAAPLPDPEVVGHALLIDGLRLPDPAPALERLTSRGLVTATLGRSIQTLLSFPALPGDHSTQRGLLHRAGHLWTSVVAYAGARAAGRNELGSWLAPAHAVADLAQRLGDEVFDPAPLLRGREIGEILGVGPGPAIGRAVTALRRAQVEGTIRTRAEAEALVRRLRSE